MKRMFNRILSALLVAVMLLTAAPLSGFVGLDIDFSWLDFSTKSSALSSSGSCGDNVTYTFDEDTGLLTIRGTGAMNNHSLSFSPFCNNSSIKSVVINYGVTSIGENAFRDCTGLTCVTIPDSVTSIEYAAFIGCTGLTSITIPDSVTSIGEDAFWHCKGLTSITIPDSVTSIGACAFSDCDSLTSVKIPNSVTSIEKMAFCRCDNLTSVTVKEGNPKYSSDEYGVLFNKDKTLLIQYPIGNTRTSYTIPDSVISIGSYAFSGCTGLTSITIPNGVTSIGYSAFEYCTGLTSIKIPNGVTSIGDSAFEYCAGLTSIAIPDSVTSIDYKTFYGCTGLQSITIPNGVTSIGYSAFEYCAGLTSITIPDNVTNIGNYAFSGCTGLTSITIPDSVTRIGHAAFGGCAGLTSITIPDSVTSIGNGAFRSCTGLTSITVDSNNTVYDSRENCNAIIETKTNTLVQGCEDTIIPNSVTRIGEDAFYGCTGLTSVTIPDSVTSIEGFAFSGCTGLTSITIPDNVTNIGNYAFYYCTGLTSVTIPDGVTRIGNYAFESCTSLMSIIIPDSVTSFGEGALDGCTKLTTLYIGSSNIYDSAFKSYTNLNNVTIGTGVTTISGYAFNGCTGLEEIVIPYSVNSIGTAAFTGCTNLGSLTVYSRNCTFSDDATAYYTTIYGFTGSTAETYANEKGFDFVAIDDTHEHVYDNACDKICNLCGDERTVGEHNFGDFTVTKEPTCTEQGEKARTCSICNFEDAQAIPATGHTYDNDCDTDCNVCGALRVPPHTDKGNDGVCDNCGEYLSDIALSTVKNVTVSAGETVYLKFIAPYTGRYTFYSSSGSDTYGYVCDGDRNTLARDDDSGSNRNFSITTTLTKGTVYYLGLKYYNSSNSGTIPVTIDYICDHAVTHAEHSDSTCNEHGYDKVICDICGVTVTTTELPYKHEYVATVTNPTCTEQGYTTYTCSLCDDSYIDDYTDALNHPNKTWRVTKNPTTTSTGLMVETCDLCGAKTGETIIPMLIPDYVTGITVSPNRLALNIGETANLTAVITPDTAENKNVIWSSSDTDVATVADGVVTAKTPGVTVIIAQSEDGGYKDFCVVRVASLTPVNGAVVDNENGLIYGITSNSADINSYVNTVDGTMSVQYNSDVIGTGGVVNIVKDGAIVDSYKVVIFGDVDGDGWYDGQDAITVSCLANGMLTREQVGEAVWMAADCNHDGVIDQLDVDLLNQAGVLLSSVDQTKPTEELLETSAEYNEYLSLIDQMGSEDAPETPTQDENDSFFTRIIAFIESIIKILNAFFTKII